MTAAAAKPAQTAASDEQVAAWFEAAQHAKASGDLGAAEREYLKVIRARPGIAEARSNLGLVHYLGNRCEDAIAQFTQALRLRPGLDMPLLFSGICHQKMHRYARAAAMLEKAAAVADPRPEAFLYLGLAYAGLDREHRALGMFEKFAAARPDEPEALYQLGGSYLRVSAEYLAKAGADPFFAAFARVELGDLQNRPARTLIARYQEAISARPSYENLHWRFARVLLQAEHVDRAEEALKNEISRQPEHIPALLLVAELRRKAGDNAAARDLLKRGHEAASGMPATDAEFSRLARTDGARAIRLLGIALELAELPPEGVPPDAHRSIGALDDTLAAIGKRIENAAPEDRTLEVYTRARMARGELPAIREELERVHGRSPGWAMATYLLGIVYQRLSLANYSKMAEADPHGHRTLLLKAETLQSAQLDEEAEAAYRKVLEKAPDSPGVHYRLGVLLLRTRRLLDAEVEFQKQMAMDPHHTAAKVGLAETYIENHRIDSAVALLETIVTQDPQLPSAPLALARAYVARGAPAAAVPMFERALKLRPGDLTAHYQLAQTYQELGRHREAEREFETVKRLRARQTGQAHAGASTPSER